MAFPVNYNIRLETTLRTLTINERFTHQTTSGGLVAASTPIAQDFLNVIANGSLTAKSIHGHVVFGALAGREIGGQATYSTVYDTATPSVLQKASAFAVEPEHRIAFAVDPNEWGKAGQSPTLQLADAIQRRVLAAYYEGGLYKH